MEIISEFKYGAIVLQVSVFEIGKHVLSLSLLYLSKKAPCNYSK